MSQLLWIVFPLVTSFGMSRYQGDPCDEFVRALRGLPNTSLTRAAGPIESIWPGEAPAACQVDFETNDSALGDASVPDFVAEPGTDMYRSGWRMLPDIIADGPGSGIYGIARGGARCVIRWEQPAFIDDDGTFVLSDTLTMTIQCSVQVQR